MQQRSNSPGRPMHAIAVLAVSKHDAADGKESLAEKAYGL